MASFIGGVVASQPASVPEPIRFGDDFEFDLAAYRLRRSGRVLKLERIPVELLALLIENRGEIVNRELIVERIWGKGAFLDTDNSINGAIRKIRQALKDDPLQPRFIQTITGKGYRFVAPVTGTRFHTPIVGPSLEVAASRNPEPKLVPGASKLSPRGLATSRWRLPITIAVVLIAGLSSYFLWAQFRGRSQRPNGRLMLAVLPFENLTGDSSQDYVSEGMTEEMITQLGSLDPEHLGVIARTSVMRYRRGRESLLQVARELGVQYVLEGSIQRDSDRVRITAQLIQMKDQTHLWARQYDRESSTLLALEEEIAREIADEIQIALGGHKPATPASLPASSPRTDQAHDFYLKGEYFWNKRTVDGFHRAIDYFQRAIASDPNYARAYAGLADSYALLGPYSGVPQAQFMPKARAAALRALEIDDRLPEAHTALGLIVQNYDWDWQTAEKEFRRAIELNPNYATAHQWYAEHLTWLGRFDEALRESERARQLDPLSLIIAADNGAILYYSRRYDATIEKLNAVREMEPNFPRALIIEWAYEQKGLYTVALADVERWRQARGDESASWAEMAYLYGRLGQEAQARIALDKLTQLSRRQSLDAAVFLRPHIGMAYKDEAIADLEKAFSQRSNVMTTLKVDPLYDPLRQDPRFQDLTRRVGLEK